jgi:hypothetical protein
MITIPVQNRLRANASGLLASAALLCAALAGAQALVIPDFRQSATPVAGPRPGEACDRCGVIRTIREIQTSRERPTRTSMAGPRNDLDSPNYVGAVIALPTNSYEGGKPYVGGVGTPEMQVRFADTSYEIIVRLDTGGYVTVQRQDGGSYRVGDRVRVQGVNLELLGQ